MDRAGAQIVSTSHYDDPRLVFDLTYAVAPPAGYEAASVDSFYPSTSGLYDRLRDPNGVPAGRRRHFTHGSAAASQAPSSADDGTEYDPYTTAAPADDVLPVPPPRSWRPQRAVWEVDDAAQSGKQSLIDEQTPLADCPWFHADLSREVRVRSVDGRAAGGLPPTTVAAISRGCCGRRPSACCGRSPTAAARSSCARRPAARRS